MLVRRRYPTSAAGCRLDGERESRKNLATSYPHAALGSLLEHLCVHSSIGIGQPWHCRTWLGKGLKNCTLVFPRPPLSEVYHNNLVSVPDCSFCSSFRPSCLGLLVDLGAGQICCFPSHSCSAWGSWSRALSPCLLRWMLGFLFSFLGHPSLRPALRLVAPCRPDLCCFKHDLPSVIPLPPCALSVRFSTQH